ncbi:MAG: ABC transporter ATP-binding protein [Desulfobacterales bacterium]
MNLLEVYQLNCFYGASQVLWDVKLTIEAGQKVAVVGSNGAGKTTLLRALSGLHKVAAGGIKWKDRNIENKHPHEIVELGISQIPEGGGIFPYMTVLENLKVGAFSKKNWQRRAENMQLVFEMFPILREREQQAAGTLSGGERQMLGIGKGLMSSPELLILDEPSAGLSPKLVLNLFDSIESIAGEGITILLVEQNVHHAMAMSDRAIIMENGRLVKEGDSKSLLEDDYVKKSYLGLS